ncbi:MAG: DUF4351 domain-containing protein [Cyanobacteriota bacterium]
MAQSSLKKGVVDLELALSQLRQLRQLRELRRRCGELSPEQLAPVRAPPLERLEELAEALLEFEAVADLEPWLGRGA